jgi:16S rRNA (uracil1498-N3)-methyltransferase
MSRFYCPQLETLILPPDESHHSRHVLRQQVGDVSTVFDGQGREWKVRITALAEEGVRFQKLSEMRSAPAAYHICLAQALTKNKSMDLIIQKATELGVGEIAPLQSDRSVPQLAGPEGDHRVEKWKQLTIEAAKQSGQNHLPRLPAIRKTREFLLQHKEPGLRLIASLQPEARSLKQTLREAMESVRQTRHVTILIGPEGDFTPAEIGEARAQGFLPVSLGPIVLRSETAAFYLLSVLAYELGDPS